MPEPAPAKIYGVQLVEALTASDDFPGAIDDQLPAVSKLPPLVACHLDDKDLDAITESAIRVTNNAPRALDFGRVCTALLQSSISGDSIAHALAKAKVAGSEKVQALLDKALESTLTVSEISKEFGLHCDLGAGVPSIVHNLRTSVS
jgi:hypothetical protein